MRIDEKRISVATNAAAGAMFGAVRAVTHEELSDDETAAARMVAVRVIEHLDEYDNRERATRPTTAPVDPPPSE